MYQDMQFEYCFAEAGNRTGWLKELNRLGQEGWVVKAYIRDARALGTGTTGPPVWCALMQRRIK